MSEFREHRFLSQDGLSLYYREYGDPMSPATPLLCLPGLTRNSRDFHALASRLAPTRRILCPDYRGRGRSEYAEGPASYHPMAHLNDIRHLAAIADLDRMIVIGTSFGGFLAMGMALIMPSSLVAVVLNDVGPKVAPGGLKRIMDYVGKDRPQPDWASAGAELKRMFPHLPPQTDEEWRAAARMTWREGPDGMLHFDWDTRLAGTIGKASGAVDPWSLFRGLSKIPVLALRGSLSDVLTPDIFARMQAENPNLIAVTVAGSGHPPSLSEPEAMESIDEFLAYR